MTNRAPVLGRFVRPVVVALGLPAVLFALWWVATADSESYYSPPLETILTTFATTWFSDRIMADVFPSVWRLFAGFFIAVILGVGLGVLVGSFRRVRAFLEPVLEFLRAIPPPVLVPVLILFAGIGDTMKVFVVVSGCIWPILLNTVEGVRAVDEVLGDTTRCYRFSRRTRMRHLVLRSASPQIATGLRQSLSVGIILMVISEMFAASNGLGFTIIQFQRSFAIPEMWSGVILLGLLGFVLALVLRIFEKRWLFWYYGLRRTQRDGS